MAAAEAVRVVADRVLAGLDELIARMGAAYREQVPEYGALSEDAMATEVLPVSRRIVEAFFAASRSGADPTPADVPEVADLGRRRLEMGVPLEPMLHVYRVAARTVWDAIVAATPEGSERLLATLGAQWMDYMDRASSVAAGSYLDASHERLRHLDARRGALVGALLSVEGPSDVVALSAEFGIAVAETYAPVVLAAAGVASRIDSVASAAPPGTVTGFRGAHVAVLVPAGADPAVVGRSLIDSEQGGTVAFGHHAAPGPPLAAEVGYTERLLGLALSRRNPQHAVVGPDDFLLEQLVTGDPRAAGALRRRVLDPMAAADRTGSLGSTLAAYLATGSVPATARAEVVHANTVTYRLGRVTALTGLDPRVPADAAVLSLALAL